MSFQYVFDNATAISITKTKKVGQTASRSGIVKATSLGVQPYQFRVDLPEGPFWRDVRTLVEKIEALDRVGIDTVSLSQTGQEYLVGYLGDESNPEGISVIEDTEPKHFQIDSGSGIASGYIFRAGDIIQPTGAKPYTVVEDVPAGSTVFEVHRPITDNVSTATSINVGTSVTWQVIAANLPTWQVFGAGQIRWEGSFVFTEVI